MIDNTIMRLPERTVKELQSVMLDICLAHATGADWKLIAIRARNAAVGGIKKKAYQMLVNADIDAIERLSKAMEE